MQEKCQENERANAKRGRADRNGCKVEETKCEGRQLNSSRCKKKKTRGRRVGHAERDVQKGRRERKQNRREQVTSCEYVDRLDVRTNAMRND
ncbi:hypothetical protein WN51_06130 [Melipona quadrifasciata]|uniref:Uncharacterized protein n=1 Tax=Melipona quadrifasciata TaxID=166423 RepID=A0A0M8ZR22_9HYME|nr:hypothetical protein WN51_06130 [Melipona quadrifasciata]